MSTGNGDKPIDFQAAKDRRTVAAIDADQACWQDVCDQLFKVLTTSGLHDSSLISATLRALLDALEGDRIEVAKDGTEQRVEGLSRPAAKDRITGSLRMFLE